MSTTAQGVGQAPAQGVAERSPGARFALGAALLGFFVITLDALIVSGGSVGSAAGPPVGGALAGWDPVIKNPTDAIVRVVRAAVCGSDLDPCRSAPATDPARHYIAAIRPDLLEGRIQPGRVFDQEFSLERTPNA